MDTSYSRYFHLKHKDFVQKGVYDGFVNKDSLFHVDPLLLKGCKIAEFETAYDDFLNYFTRFIPLAKNANPADHNNLFFKRMEYFFTFKEIPNTGLGFSKGNSNGSGVSGRVAKLLAKSAYDIINAGMVDPEIFCLMQLIEEKIGPDRISDMTIAILQKHILSYTERIATELGIPTQPYVLEDNCFRVPFYNKKPMHFLPISILANLPIAYDFEDVNDVCDYNDSLKRKVANIIGLKWMDYKDYKKQDWKKIILNNKQCYDAVIEGYKRLTGVAYDFKEDKKELYRNIELQELLDENPLDINYSDQQVTEESVYVIAKKICLQFKHLIEYNRLSELFFKRKRTPDESDWQLLLYAIADTYLQAAKLDIIVFREHNPGCGEIDFQFSNGAQSNTIIEIKRSSNKDLYHGFRTQLASYMNATRAKDGIFLVIMEDDSKEQIIEKLKPIQEDMRQKGEYVPEIIFVNGVKQYSASHPKYESPKI